MVAGLGTYIGTNTVTPPAGGWTLATSGVASSNALYVYYIANAASQSGAKVWNTGVSNNEIVLIMAEYAGPATTSPLDKAVLATGTGSVISSGTATTVSASEALLHFCISTNANATNLTFTGPTGGFTTTTTATASHSP